MRDYILKREKIIHILSLVTVVASVFLQELNLKFALLVLGIFGLLAIASAKRNKTTTIIFILLLVLACVGYYLIDSGKWTLPQN